MSLKCGVRDHNVSELRKLLIPVIDTRAGHCLGMHPHASIRVQEQHLSPICGTLAARPAYVINATNYPARSHVAEFHIASLISSAAAAATSCKEKAVKFD